MMGDTREDVIKLLEITPEEFDNAPDPDIIQGVHGYAVLMADGSYEYIDDLDTETPEWVE